MGAAVFELFRGSLYLAVDATLAGTAVSAPAAPVPSTTFSSLDQIVARGTIPPRPSRPDGSLVLNTKCQTLTRLSRYLGVRYLHPHEITSTDEQLLGTILTKFRRVLLEHMYFFLGYDRLEDAADDSKTYRGEYIRSLITQAEYGIMAAVRLRPQPFAICPMNEFFYIERQDVLKPELIWLPRGNS